MTALASARFWAQTGERAVKSFAQGVLSTWLGVGQVLGVDDVSSLWSAGPWVGGAATAVFSVLTSVASAPVGNDDGPSMI